MSSSGDDRYNIRTWPYSESFLRNQDDDGHEILDPETIQRRLERHRNSLKNTGVQPFSPIQKETKALTTIKSHGLDYYTKKIIYCPSCKGDGPASRMTPYHVSYLINNDALAAYEELVGGLAVPDDAIFLHCKRCNYKMLAEADDAHKLDAVTPQEYVIESVNDPQRRQNKKPIIAGQTKRFNRFKDAKSKEMHKRVQQAKEKMDREALQGRESTPENG